MKAKGGSATMVSPEDLGPARPQAGRRQRSPRGGAAVVRPAKTHGHEVEGDLGILNRNARRLNREARDVLSFQVPVSSAASCIEFATLPAEIPSALGFSSSSVARS